MIWVIQVMKQKVILNNAPDFNPDYKNRHLREMDFN